MRHLTETEIIHYVEGGSAPPLGDPITEFQQCFVTTADIHVVPPSRLAGMHRYRVHGGTAQRVTVPA